MTMSVSMSGTNLYEAARLTGGSSIMENLQSQLKLREGEIAQLQVEIHMKLLKTIHRVNACVSSTFTFTVDFFCYQFCKNVTN